MRRTAFLLFLVAAGALYYGSSEALTAQQQRRAPAAKRVDYGKFKHSTHRGTIASISNPGQQHELKCNFCHKDPTPDAPEVTGYPNTKPGSTVTHSACTDCHTITGRTAVVEGTNPKMCLICHSSTRVAEMSRNIRAFPNPASGPESQFFDYYSHADHVGFFAESATFKTRFADKAKFKDKDHFECVACHTNAGTEAMKIGGIDYAAGVRESAPGHAECFVCHFNEKEVSPKSQTFATACVGCHSLTQKQRGAGSEHAALWFVRQIVAPEMNPPPPAGAKAPKAFSHKTHDKEVGSDTKSCLECHATGKTAVRRSDFFAAERRTQEKQPRAGNCIDCHDREMQQKITGAMTLEKSKCNFCHALPTIRDRGAKGVALPPPDHFPKPKPTPTPTPKPPATTPPAATKPPGN